MVKLRGRNALHMAELQVLNSGGTNLALNKTATQSSTFMSLAASRAVDGNTDGTWGGASMNHTEDEDQPWLQVDLGSVQSIASVKVWNRTDGVMDRLSNFDVLVSDVAFTAYRYDANGNVTHDGAHSYTFDAENRVVSVDGGTTATYAYDHQNRRVQKVTGGTTTHYVWEGNQCIAEHNGSTGAVVTEYIFAGSRMVAREQGGNRLFFLHDRLSVRATITDGQGSIQGRMAMLPFGEELNVTGTTDKHKFTSYERDSESSIDYAVNRQFSPSVGRFNQIDPIGSKLGAPQALNRYTYAINDPINFVDTDGLDFSFTAGATGSFWYCFLFPDYCDDWPDLIPDQRPTRQQAGSANSTAGWFPGFNAGSRLVIEFAVARALSLLNNSQCKDNLRYSNPVDPIDPDLIIQYLGGGRIKADTEDDTVPGPFNLFFNGGTSRLPGVMGNPGRDTAVTRGYNRLGQVQIFLYPEFFVARRANSRINLLTSQAIVLIHETIHAQGFSDSNLGGSTAIDNMIIRSCIDENLNQGDMAL